VVDKHHSKQEAGDHQELKLQVRNLKGLYQEAKAEVSQLTLTKRRNIKFLMKKQPEFSPVAEQLAEEDIEESEEPIIS
jgi:hypothetical protein